VNKLKRNKIKWIRASISIKEDMMPIKTTPLFQEYYFNEKGAIVKQLETYYKLYNQIDTILTSYVYNDKGMVMKEIKKGKQGYYAYSYSYKNKLLKTLTYTKSKDFPTGINEIVVYKESFEHIVEKNQRQSYTINDIGKRYKVSGIVFNALNHKKEEYNKLIMNNIGHKYTYLYNDFSRVVQRTKTKTPSHQETSVVKYQYDNLGNLMTEVTSTQGIQQKKKEFIYDERLLLKAELSKDEITGTITIYKLNYGF